MITAITQHRVADKTLTDAVGNHLVQVLLQHHAFSKQRVGIGSGEDGIELVEAFDHFLTASGAGMNRLDADRPAVEQMLRRTTRILHGKNTEAVEYHATHAFGKQR